MPTAAISVPISSDAAVDQLRAGEEDGDRAR